MAAAGWSLRLAGGGVAATGCVAGRAARWTGRGAGTGRRAVSEWGGRVVSAVLPAAGGAWRVPAAAGEMRLRAGEIFVAMAGELRDVGLYRLRRRMWCRDGEAHLEVRGLALAAGDVLGDEVTEALGRLKGVHWAEINAVTQQVLVSFDEDHVDLEAILGTIEAVEEEHEAQAQPFSRSKPEIPGDRSPEYAATVALASGLAGMVLATAGRVSLRTLPSQAIRLPIVLAESQPRLRAALEGRLGRTHSDLLFQLVDSAAYVATADPFPLAVDVAARALGLMEARSRRLVWERRALELRAYQSVPIAASRPARPVPLPPGPIEKTSERSSLAALAAAGGVLAWTRDAGKAADLLLGTVPKAARTGREGFAAMLCHELSRAGILPMNTSALRHLDRVSTVVIDSVVLAGDGEPDPLADALIGAARSGGLRVLLTEHPAVAEFASCADETVPAGAEVADRVRRLQAEGHCVLVISDRDGAALAAADVGVAVLRGPWVCWSADLICGSGLEQAWRVLRSVQVARQVSERSARLAVGGGALGALLAASGRRRTRAGLAPAHSAAGVAVLSGAISARRLARSPVPEPAPRGRWHEMAAEQVLHRLSETATADGERDRERTRSVGLTAQLAHAVSGELRDPLTPVLALGAAASAIVGSGVDAALVGGVMAGNAVIGGLQRVRAERALRSLLLGERLPARLITEDGSVRSVPADRLRPGDVISLHGSDVVPADVRLLECEFLEVDEATITGESLPVPKDPAATPGADLADRSCMLYEGTTIITGRARGVVVAAGSATEAGRAASAVGDGTQPIGVQARLGELTRITMPTAGIAGAAVTALSLAHHVPVRQAIASGVAIAVAAVPEGLPLVATVSQLAAARRLSKHGILVRSPRTLEALGRVDTFCFDKTGTLTEGRLTLARLADIDRELREDDDHGRHLLRTAARACPKAEDVIIHATDRAIVERAGERLGPDEDWQLSWEIPFETNRGYAASFGTDSPGPALAVKGAPEVILGRCTRDHHGRPMTPDRLLAATARIESLAADGLRVIAVAESHPHGEPPPCDIDALAQELSLLGFVAIADLPRPTASATIERLTQAGVRITLITGDHPATATAVARQLGIPDGDAVLTGAELDRLSEQQRLDRVRRTSVFARVSPEHKVRIVQALQQAGHVVAMTGDGANDAAAIRLADVGIGMAARSSTAARGAADLVLTDSDPLRLIEALAEGRALWSRVRDAVSILVGGNAGEVAFTLLGTAIGGRAPLNTRQLLLVNMLTDMLPALAVALGTDDRSPGGHGDGILAAGPVTLSGADLARTLATRGGATALGASLAWYAGRLTGRSRRADTMGLAALVSTQLGQTLIIGRGNPFVLVTCVASAAVLVGIVETPGVSHFFGCTPLGPIGWGTVAASSAAGTAAAAIAPRILPMAEAGR
ncbi:cation-translocating P-type ATPase [Actinoallomurus vinaceus]|uniref:Cation-translocating P-type ATPase n=2 Tax=Actinoallomurus vinaceus TaxID=1080074 RepID=A0ABP8U6B9_9ACTN